MVAELLARFYGFPCGGDLLCVGMIVAIIVLAGSTRKTARRCPRCKEINRPHAVFCAQCGARL